MRSKEEQTETYLKWVKKTKEDNKKYREKNKEKCNEYGKEYYKKNKEKAIEYTLKYKKENTIVIQGKFFNKKKCSKEIWDLIEKLIKLKNKVKEMENIIINKTEVI